MWYTWQAWNGKKNQVSWYIFVFCIVFSWFTRFVFLSTPSFNVTYQNLFCLSLSFTLPIGFLVLLCCRSTVTVFLFICFLFVLFILLPDLWRSSVRVCVCVCVSIHWCERVINCERIHLFRNQCELLVAISFVCNMTLCFCVKCLLW